MTGEFIELERLVIRKKDIQAVYVCEVFAGKFNVEIQTSALDNQYTLIAKGGLTEEEAIAYKHKIYCLLTAEIIKE